MSDPDRGKVDQKADSFLASMFVNLTSRVTSTNDTTEIFSLLTKQSVDVLPIAMSGILLRDDIHQLQLVNSSTQIREFVDMLRVQESEGPCHAAYMSGLPVINQIDTSTSTWPTFDSAASRLGMKYACAIPLKSRDVVVGSFGFFGPSVFGDREFSIAKALSDSATIALLQSDPNEDSIVLARQLRATIEARNALEQAKGILVVRFSCDEDFAVGQLRAAARMLGSTVRDVALGVVARDSSTEIGKLLSRPIVAPDHSGSDTW